MSGSAERPALVVSVHCSCMNPRPHPPIAVDHHHEIDAAGVSGACCTMRERSGLVVGVGPALPVADADRTVRPAGIRIRIGKHRTQQNCDRSSPAFHKRFPHTPRASIFVLCNRSPFGLCERRLKFPGAVAEKRPGIGLIPAGGPTPEALSLRSLRDHSAHRLDRRKIGTDSHPPAARQLIAWQENWQDNAWTWHGAEAISSRGTCCVRPRSC